MASYGSYKSGKPAEGYTLIYCEGWDYSLGESWEGGRIIDAAPTEEEAITAARGWAYACRRQFGEGRLYVTDPEHRLVAIVDPDAVNNPIRMLASPRPAGAEVGAEVA